MPTSPDKVLLKAAIDLDAVGLKRALKQGADPNATDTKGRTALMLLGQKLMAMYLAGQYLYVSSALKQDDIKTSVQALLAAGARVDAVDHEGCTALHNPLYHAFCPSAVEMLLQQGAPVNHAASYGATPAHVCAAHGVALSLWALAEAGGDWSARIPGLGNLPIHVAASAGNALALRYLVGLGYSLREPNARGETAIHLALEARRDLESVAQVLLECDACPTMQDLRGIDESLWTSNPHRLAALIRLYLAAQPTAARKESREWILSFVAGAVQANKPLEWGGAPEALAQLLQDSAPLGKSSAAFDLMAAVLKRSIFLEGAERNFAADLVTMIVWAQPDWDHDQIQSLLEMAGDLQNPEVQAKVAPLLALQQSAELEALQDLDAPATT